MKLLKTLYEKDLESGNTQIDKLIKYKTRQAARVVVFSGQKELVFVVDQNDKVIGQLDYLAIKSIKYFKPKKLKEIIKTNPNKMTTGLNKILGI